ncbi:MAG: exo-alpha-sialidase [Planctomycetaceae bacterium]|nr:exo-alpha-sialidase [Planctomycetaceae bacterium]
MRRLRELITTVFVLLAAAQVTPLLNAAEPTIDTTLTITAMAPIVRREGITGAGWGLFHRQSDDPTTDSLLRVIYPNHPDDWGKSGGTGSSYSRDGGRTWTVDPDNRPLPGMVDMWQDRLSSGELVTFGLRKLVDREQVLAAEPTASLFESGPYAIGRSQDHGQSWSWSEAMIHSSPEHGVIARPLPHIFEVERGTWLMPAYSWSRTGHRTLLLRSLDQGRNWSVAGTIATVAAIRAAGVTVATPWLETAVTETADGTLLAVMRTASNAQGALVSARSADHGVTWSNVERVLTGPERRVAAGKLPNLVRLANGPLILLTAHSKNHCRLYVSHDGCGRAWSDGLIVTSVSGGNTSLTMLDEKRISIATPANGRIDAWQVTYEPATDIKPGSVEPPREVRVDSEKSLVTWQPGATDVAFHLVRPVLVQTPPENRETERFAYLPIRTSDATPRIELNRVLMYGASYRIEIVSVTRDGRRSSIATSAEFVAGVKPAVSMK